MLFHRWRRKLSLQVFDESGDVGGVDVCDLADAVLVAPFRKVARGVEIRLARMVVVDLRGEKLQRPPSSLPRRGEDRNLGDLRGRRRIRCWSWLYAIDHPQKLTGEHDHF